MRAKLLSMVLASLFLLSATTAIAQTDPPPQEFNLEEYEFVEDQLLVSFKPTIKNERANEVLTELGVERVQRLDQIQVDVLRLPPGLTVEKALEIFNKRPEVAYAEPNFLISIAGPLDAEVVDQWGLQKIQAPEAWTLIPEEDRVPVLLAVVDTGIDPNNPLGL